MQYISGVISGILLTILVVFVIDHVNQGPGVRPIVNWDVVAASVGAGAEKVGDTVRQDLHTATAPKPADQTPANQTPAPQGTAPATPPASAQ
jgi:hypothetical protein